VQEFEMHPSDLLKLSKVNRAAADVSEISKQRISTKLEIGKMKIYENGIF
jgi:hypothetical protein